MSVPHRGHSSFSSSASGNTAPHFTHVALVPAFKAPHSAHVFGVIVVGGLKHMMIPFPGHPSCVETIRRGALSYLAVTLFGAERDGAYIETLLELNRGLIRFVAIRLDIQ